VTDQTVTPEAAKSDPWAEIADELERIARDCRDLVGEPAPCTFYLGVQPYTPTPIARAAIESRPAAVAAVDAVSVALLGHPAKTERMSSGTFHHTTKGDRGPIHLDIYQQVADPDADERDAELARLRAEVEQLRAAVPTPEVLHQVADKLRADQAADPSCRGVPPGFEADCGIPGPHGPHGPEPLTS
jgi:hypothetical protein